jgi:hypothetical protein
VESLLYSRILSDTKSLAGLRTILYMSFSVISMMAFDTIFNGLCAQNFQVVHIFSQLQKPVCNKLSLCKIIKLKLFFVNALKTKRKLFHLKTQFVTRSKHFSSRLKKQINLFCIRQKSVFVVL